MKMLLTNVFKRTRELCFLQKERKARIILDHFLSEDDVSSKALLKVFFALDVIGMRLLCLFLTSWSLLAASLAFVLSRYWVILWLVPAFFIASVFLRLSPLSRESWDSSPVVLTREHPESGTRSFLKDFKLFHQALYKAFCRGCGGYKTMAVIDLLFHWGVFTLGLFVLLFPLCLFYLKG